MLKIALRQEEVDINQWAKARARTAKEKEKEKEKERAAKAAR